MIEDQLNALADATAAIDADMTELRSLGPQRGGTDLAWFSRRGRWLLISYDVRRSGPVLVLSLWSENSYQERFPIKDACYEMGCFQLPEFGRAIVKAINMAREGAGERLVLGREAKALRAQRAGGER